MYERASLYPVKSRPSHLGSPAKIRLGEESEVWVELLGRQRTNLMTNNRF
jgi:hypothetical protein